MRRVGLAAMVAGCAWLTASCGSGSATPVATRAPGAAGSTTVTACATTTTRPGNIPFLTAPTGPGGTPPLTPLPRSAFKTTSEVPRSTGPAASTAAVTVIKPNHTNEAPLVAAFTAYQALAGTCKAETVAGTVYLATIRATGVSWAVAGFKPATGCHQGSGPDLQRGSQVPPFDDVPPPVAVLEKQPGGAWMENNEAGKPFPCPPADAVPGRNNPYVPVEVLDAWKIPYVSADCEELFVTPPG